MRKLFIFLLCIAVVTPAMAQTEPVEPVNWGDALQSFAALALTIPLVVDFFKLKLKLQGLTLQILSWGIGIIIGFIAWWLNIGIFAGLIWWQTLAVGVGASLVANGVADTGIIRTILAFFGINVNKHKA